MRIQLYPENGVAFVGTQTHELRMDDLPPGLIEFDSADVGHPYFHRVHRLIPEPAPVGDVIHSAGPDRRKGLCWATTEYVEGRQVNTFHFDNVGDQLPWHTHDELTVHTSDVAQGSFTLETKDGKRTIKQGDFIDWAPNEWHGFTALEAGSVLINRVKKKRADA